MFQLDTPRLILRDFVADDWQAMHLIFADDETTRYIDWLKSETEVDTQKRVNDIIYHNACKPRISYNLLIERKTDQASIGWIGIGGATDQTLGDLDFGYALGKAYWGQGFMTEALQHLLDFSFQTLHVKKIFGVCDIANVGSVRVMEKVGMTLEATLIKQNDTTGRIDESLRFAILYEDWLREREVGKHHA
ncbi:MAG: GNAT family N-acetyltransferase [Chloroflexota bacterium]